MTTFPKHTIYLAGPITGLTHDEARYGWREEFATKLNDMEFQHIFCNSPMRSKEFLKDSGVLSSGHDYPEHVLATPAGITTRDYNDVKTCSVMVACFLESGNRPSLGTAAEFGYAWAHQKPIVVIGPKNDVNIQHCMLQRMAGYRVDTVEEAVLVVGHILTPRI